MRSSGLGWPEQPVRDDGAGLGWPRDGAPLSEDRPADRPIEPLPPAPDVSRETRDTDGATGAPDAEESGGTDVSRETEAAREDPGRLLEAPLNPVLGPRPGPPVLGRPGDEAPPLVDAPAVVPAPPGAETPFPLTGTTTAKELAVTDQPGPGSQSSSPMGGLVDADLSAEPVLHDDTPIARAAETALRVLAGRVGDPLPAPAETRVLDGRQPEGRRRQDHDHGEPGRGPGAAGARGPRHRPRPAGQRLDGARRRAPRRGARRSTRCSSTGRPLAEVVAAGRRHRRPVVRAGDDRPGRRRDRAGLPGRARDPAAEGAERLPRVDRRRRPGAARLRAHRLPAVARAAHGERAGRGAARCSSRSSASTTRWRASASCCATSSWSRRTSTRGCTCRRSC